jgi:hypothetical protein
MLRNSKNLPRGGKNCGTIRYRPNGLRASDPQMSDRDKDYFDCRVQRPDQLLAMIINDDIRCDQFDPEDWIEIEQAAESRQIFEESLKVKAENVSLKAENAALKAEIAALKSQQSSPPAPESLIGTGYRDAVTISPATIQMRTLANFFRRTRLFVILLWMFNQIIKYRCKFDDDDEVEVEGCGSVLRKIFELITSMSADISQNTLTIPDLDFKFYGSKKDFETFSKKVSEWIGENGLNIPGTHFIIRRMNCFTAKKIMSNGQIVEYEKFTLEVIDSSTKEIFIIDVMNMDGSTFFPIDFSVNAFTFSPKCGIYAKDPMHRKGKINFIDVIFDIISKTTACLTRSTWNFDEFSLKFLVRQIKMREAGYEMQGAPVLTIARCPVMCDDELCISLTGCRCKNTKGEPIPVMISIYTAIRLYQEEKRCPNCRGIFSKYFCSTVKSKQSMQEPNDLPSKLEIEHLIKCAEEMSQGFSVSGLQVFSEKSKDALRVLFDFSRKSQNDRPDILFEELDHHIRDLQMEAEADARFRYRAPQIRAGGAAAAPVRALQYSSDSDSDEEFYMRRIILRGY